MNSLLLNNNNEDLALVAKIMTSILFPVEAQPLFGDPRSPNFILPSLTLESLSKDTIEVLVPIIKEYCKAEYKMCIGTSSIKVTWNPKDPCDMTGYSAFMSSWYRIASILADTMVTRKNSVDRGFRSVKPIPVNACHATCLVSKKDIPEVLSNKINEEYSGFINECYKQLEQKSADLEELAKEISAKYCIHTVMASSSDSFTNEFLDDLLQKDNTLDYLYSNSDTINAIQNSVCEELCKLDSSGLEAYDSVILDTRTINNLVGLGFVIKDISKPHPSVIQITFDYMPLSYRRALMNIIKGNEILRDNVELLAFDNAGLYCSYLDFSMIALRWPCTGMTGGTITTNKYIQILYSELKKAADNKCFDPNIISIAAIADRRITVDMQAVFDDILNNENLTKKNAIDLAERYITCMQTAEYIHKRIYSSMPGAQIKAILLVDDIIDYLHTIGTETKEFLDAKLSGIICGDEKSLVNKEE